MRDKKKRKAHHMLPKYNLFRQTILLSERDWDIVMHAVDHPAEPNEALKQAVERFRESETR